MAYLTVLMNRVNTVEAVMEMWAEYEAGRAAQVAEALQERPHVRRVTFRDDVTPHYGNLVTSYIAEVIAEHRRAIRQGLGAARLHTDAIAAWQVAGRCARNDSPREQVKRHIEVARELSEQAVRDARRRR